MVTVRRATVGDVAAVRAVGLATWPSTYGALIGDAAVEAGLATWWSAERVLRGITELTTYVAEIGGGKPAAEPAAVVGAAVVGELDRYPMLFKLYVRPEHQREGVGRRLLGAVVAGLPADADRLRLDHVEGNDTAHAFYLAAAFVEVGRHDSGEGYREVRMERRLR